MSNFLGIELVAGLNKKMSSEKINQAISDMQKDGFDNIEVDIKVDGKALKTIEEFNKQMKNLSIETDKTSRNLKRATLFDSDGKAVKNIAKLRDETKKLSKEQFDQARQAKKNFEEQADSAKKLDTIVTRIGKKGGKSTTESWVARDGSSKEKIVDGQLAEVTQDMRYMEKVSAKQEKVRNLINQIRSRGLGDQKQLGLFDVGLDKIKDLDRLDGLYNNIQKYNRELSQATTPQERIQRTIDSMKRLHKMGEIRLPKRTMITDLEEQLKSATTVKEIDAVNHRLGRLQDTLKSREKAFKDIENLRKDGILDSKVLTKAREDVRRAESPEQMRKLAAHIEQLKQDNQNEKAINREIEQIANERQKAYRKLAEVNNEYQQVAKKGVIGMFDRQISEGDSVDSIKEATRNIDEYSKHLRAQVKEDGEIAKEIEGNKKHFDNLAAERNKVIKKLSEIPEELGADKARIKQFTDSVWRVYEPEDIKGIHENVDSYISALRKQNREDEAELKESERIANARRKLKKDIELTTFKYGDDSRLTDIYSRVDQSDLKGMEILKTQHREVTLSLQKQNQLLNARRTLERDIQKLRFSVTAVPKEMETQLLSIQSAMAALSPDTKNLSNEVGELMNSFHMVRDRIIDADQGLARFSRQTVSALLRVPIYAATIAAMYTPMRAFNDALRQTVELDSQLTVLERVSNGTIEMNQALESSIDIAHRLGNTIAEVNDGLIAFARQGFRGDDLTKITEVATLMSNVSDLNVEEASGSLTAAMKGFNIEAENSMHIVNALNEVDNNYAVTTQQLAEALQRSAGTSSVYGSTLERNIAYSTAIAEVTRESGRIIGKHKIAV